TPSPVARARPCRRPLLDMCSVTSSSEGTTCEPAPRAARALGGQRRAPLVVRVVHAPGGGEPPGGSRAERRRRPSARDVAGEPARGGPGDRLPPGDGRGLQPCPAPSR